MSVDGSIADQSTGQIVTDATLTKNESAFMNNITNSESVCAESELSSCETREIKNGGTDNEEKKGESDSDVCDNVKHQLVTGVNAYEKLGSNSPASQIDQLTLDSADEISGVNRVNLNNKRSISPTPPLDPSQKMPNCKKPKECIVSMFLKVSKQVEYN